MNLEPIANRLAPLLSAGIALYRDVRLRDAAALDEYIAAEVARWREAHLRSLPPAYEWTRRLYRALHIDPTRHRPSSEALWRRLRDRADFPRVNAAVDLTNLLSLRFQVCYGLYDAALVHGPLEIDRGGERDRYVGIGKEEMSFTGKIVLRDGEGAFGNPSADSRRTAVTAAAGDILQVLYLHGETPGRESYLQETTAVFTRFFAVRGLHTAWV